MNSPSIYVLIINWNGLEHLEECFDSLLTTSYANAFFALVDNDSDDDSVEFVKARYAKDARVTILKATENLGWSKGNNLGIEWALKEGADYILLLNNDTRTENDALTKLIAMAEENPSIGALSPKLLMYDSPNILNSIGIEASVIGSSWDLGIGRLDTEEWNAPREILGACGAALFIRASVLEKTGLLPDDYEIYLDDLDLCLRIWNAGFIIQSCPAAVIHHKFSATTGHGEWAKKKYFLNTRNRIKIIMRFFPVYLLPITNLYFLVGEIRAVGRAILNGEFWKIKTHVLSCFIGIAEIPKAVRLRKEFHRKGLKPGVFWHFVRWDKMFFEGTVFPKCGFYPKTNEGEFPISSSAHWYHAGGELAMCLTNPLPENGKCEIEIMHNDISLAIEEIDTKVDRKLELEPGEIKLVSKSIFTKEDTGLLYDIGGLIQIFPFRDPHDETSTV
jgi:hypothetical protein